MVKLAIGEQTDSLIRAIDLREDLRGKKGQHALIVREGRQYKVLTYETRFERFCKKFTHHTVSGKQKMQSALNEASRIIHKIEIKQARHEFVKPHQLKQLEQAKENLKAITKSNITIHYKFWFGKKSYILYNLANKYLGNIKTLQQSTYTLKTSSQKKLDHTLKKMESKFNKIYKSTLNKNKKLAKLDQLLDDYVLVLNMAERNLNHSTDKEFKLYQTMQNTYSTLKNSLHKSE